MSDPKRASLITVGASKSEKNSVCKTVRLTINLDESNESKYPELNYKELVIAEDRKKRVENGKTNKLDPFSDNDEELERVAKKFEQKYGGKSTYGRKGRSKHDDFADIGMGYDENDPFIDNTDNYDEMMPPETDTFYGGFYINSGSLEFKSVPENRIADVENGRRNKRRISSSSSEEESSDSSSESESADEKETKTIPNGAVHNEHRKKKNKDIDKKKKAKKIRRTDSSAATSGKQTSDDNGHGDAESADSRTSHSDSLTSKPAPSSENAVTSDSSRDVEAKSEVKLPQPVIQVLEQLEAAVSKHQSEHPDTPVAQLTTNHEKHLLSLDAAISSSAATARARRAAWGRAAVCLRSSRAKLIHRVQARLKTQTEINDTKVPASPIAQTTTATATPTATNNNKRKYSDEADEDISKLTAEQREAKIVDTLQRLKALIEDRTPAMMASYQAECDRVMEERKKLQIASDGRPIEKRLPKRRFPWCQRSRSLLARLKRLAGDQDAAANLLVRRALPLFPSGFVRMPTLLRQADLSKELKVSDVKRQRSSSVSAPALASAPAPAPAPAPVTPLASMPEPIQFPSSLTVTTSIKPIDKTDEDKSKSVFGNLINSFSISKDLIVEPEKKDPEPKKEDVVPNSIGSITITPVVTKEKKSVPSNPPTKEPLLRVKSPAVLNEMAKKDKHKLKDKPIVKDKRVDSPLHIDTTFSNKKETPSPTTKEDVPKKALTKEEIAKKQIENMRISENNIPRPALVPVHHSPTFAKPDKRPPEVKKKKEIVIISDLDPLGDVQQEPVVAVDDSSSDVEVIEENKSEPSKCEVPKDKVSDKKVSKKENHRKEDALEDDIHTVMRNLREMEHSQETPKFNNSFGGVITSAKHEKSSKPYSPRVFGDRSDKDKLLMQYYRNLK
ncbi:yemanuclein isoform X3 [Leguminivora glycinivorella]|uniref:yemanuclein isoform X3 n=1 Tax=Leguminivora glycinivorella TaxID=1035111 RepID=UPI00200EFC55|nr:yemanuclein isoform X3 [Leguminivora glycinivorella]